MLTKKSLIVLLLVIAVALSLFSLAQAVYSGYQSNARQSSSEADLGGNLQLGVLPYEETSMQVSEAAGE